jgi:mannose-6-phosphate isomerase-like protein (cupin superfamily)
LVLVVALVLLLLLGACAAPSTPPTPEVVVPDLAERVHQLEQDPAPNAVSNLIDGHGAVSGRVIRVRAPIPLHVHEHSDELVYILAGSGVFTIAGKRIDVAPGAFTCVPRGTPHAFAPGAQGTVAISLYTPAFRDGDRVPVDDR